MRKLTVNIKLEEKLYEQQNRTPTVHRQDRWLDCQKYDSGDQKNMAAGGHVSAGPTSEEDAKALQEAREENQNSAMQAQNTKQG